MPDPLESSSTDAPSAVGGERQFPCARCGAKLEFSPGTTVLKCPYCAHENPIVDSSEAAVQEIDYSGAIRSLEAGAPTEEVLVVKCGACAAEATPPPNVTAFPCPYCGSNIVATAHSVKHIKPNGVLPFSVRRDESRGLFRKWIASRWFAPSELKRRAGIDDGVVGIYIPAWTYDCAARTDYTGARGDHYYTTQHYTAMVNGRPIARTRQVRHTRWSGASGVIHNRFDDLLIIASRSLPPALLHQLEPWDLKNIVPYRDDFLSGFRAESYQVDLGAGFELAKAVMSPIIAGTVRADIGGDEQRIDSMKIQHDNITFKHLLLPVWLSAYRYRDKVYRFMVNARTGEVQGDRPYSAWKITLTVLAGLLALLVVGLVIAARG